MNLVNGLHGTPALLLLCGLLFAEEAGVPLPFAPGELVVLAGGLLIATGGLNPLLFVPLATAACIAGSLLGFGWARAVGPTGLRKLAAKLHQQKALEKVEHRVQSAGAVGLGISRLIPGLRIYTTLVAGALRTERRTFLVAIVPTTAAWVLTFTVLGAVVGIPVEHFFNKAAMLALEGVILVGMGVGAYIAIRHTPPSSESGVLRAPRSVRIVGAVVIDLAVLASVVTGVTELGRRVVNMSFGDGWLEAAAILFVSVLFYVVVARRGPGATMGESLMQTTYISGRRAALSPVALLGAARGVLNQTPDELAPTARALHTLGDANRLQLVSQMLREARTLAELARLTSAPPVEVRHRIGPLVEAGIVSEDDGRYRVLPALARPLTAFIALSGGAEDAGPAATPLPAKRSPAGRGARARAGTTAGKKRSARSAT